MAATTLYPLITRVVLPLAIGGVCAIIGYAIRDVEADEEKKHQPKQSSETALQKQLLARGTQMLRDRDQAELREMNHREYLSYVYRALYCIGRAGGQLNEAYATQVATLLASLHSQIRPQKDEAIVTWMQDLGYHHPSTLGDLIADCKEVKDLGIDARYIAHAMRETPKGLSFSGLTKELVAKL